MNGVYALMIQICKRADIRIGSIGIIRFKRGTYAYVGSAQNGLCGRIERHLRKDKKTFWHIDYLLRNEDCEITSIFVADAPKQKECALAHQLAGCFVSVPHFGSSDCRCFSHLFEVSNDVLARELMKQMIEYPLTERIGVER